MNEKELERRLRTERGPRDEGYHPAALPETLGQARAEPGPSGLTRLALLVPAAVAGVIAVALVAGSLSGRGPLDPGDQSSPTPSAGASSADAPIACRIQDLAFSAEPWTAGAGSRGTVVSVRLADGRSPCETDTWAGGSISDEQGTVLVTAAKTLQERHAVVIQPGKTYTIGVAWSNWCTAPPAMPVSLSIQQGMMQSVVVSTPEPGADPVPPCLGENQPTNLSVTDLQPAPE